MIIGVFGAPVIYIATHIGASGVLSQAYGGTTLSSDSLLTKINKVRQDNNLQELEDNSELAKIAYERAVYIITSNEFAHQSSEGIKWIDFIENSNVVYKTAGENLAKNYKRGDEVVKEWMASPAHKENIINEGYNITGISVVNSKDIIADSKMGVIIVQLFVSQ